MNAMRSLLAAAVGAALALPFAALAQHAGHDMSMPMQMPMPVPAKKRPVVKPVAKPIAKPAATKPKPKAKPKPATAPPSAPQMDHSGMQGMDHFRMEGMDHSRMEGMDHSQMEGMDHSQMPGMQPATSPVVTPVPPFTEADRAAAFPTVHMHHQHGTSINSFWMLDRLEISDADPGTALGWDGIAWVGGDVQRLWLRSEGTAADGRIDDGDIEVLYGRGVRAWWDVVAGLRQDVGEGPSRTWAAVGVQGLAPYKFEVAATAYVGQGGRTAVRAEAEYDTLFTNRLILQWRAEADAYGKSDPLAGIGSGLSTVEAGVRLRYEITRQFAPYVGIEHERAVGKTADLRRAAGHGAGDTRLVAGLRLWF